MPKLFNTETISFYGMEKEELHFAYHRYRRSTGEHHSVLRRIWWRNRLAVLLGAIVFFSLAIGYVWAMVRLLGTGFLFNAIGAPLSLVLMYFLAKSKTMTELAERWKHEEERARDLFEVDAETASAAASLYHERWPDDALD